MMNHPVPSQGPMANQAPFLVPVMVMVVRTVVVIVTVSVVRGQVVVTVWEYQSSDQVRLASRTPPSDQQRRGFVVPVEPCVLGRLGVGQPQDEILWWLRLRRLPHRWPEQFLSFPLLLLLQISLRKRQNIGVTL